MIHEERQNLKMAKSVKTLFGVVMNPTKQIMGLDKSISLRDISLASWVNYILRIY